MSGGGYGIGQVGYGIGQTNDEPSCVSKVGGGMV